MEKPGWRIAMKSQQLRRTIDGQVLVTASSIPQA